MQAINKYNWILFVVPFVLVIIGGWFLDLIPNRSFISKAINKLLEIITEKNLKELLLFNNIAKTEEAAKKIQRLRIGFTLIAALMLTISFGSGVFSKIFVFFITIIIAYKFIYIYLLYLDRARIKRMNILLPYALKTLSYLIYQYEPVTAAIKMAIPLVPKEFKHDFELLYEDLFNCSNSSDAFNNMINKYDGKLENLDSYFKLINRLQQSGISQAGETLANLNRMISDNVNIARQEKYDIDNAALAYWGLLPVALLTIALIGLLLIFVQNMNLG